MRGRHKRNDHRERSERAGFSPLPGEIAAGLDEPDAPVHGATVCDVGGTKRGSCSIYGNEKVYLGVRVRMPVKDLLKNIRLAQGWGPQDLKERYGKTAKGDLKRAKTRSRHQTVKVQHPSKSLEELSIIVEVLEEDLRTGNSHLLSPPPLSPTDPPVSPQLSSTGFISDEYDDMILNHQSYRNYSPETAEYHQAQSPPGFMFPSYPPSGFGILGKNCEQREEWPYPQNNYDLNNSTFFWTQLQKEECQLRDVSNSELLATDDYGKTVLHKVACVGKRALGYAIAKRMTTFNSLDLKDSDGMTPLLYASKHNHHLMVADLIYLGANVNETNNTGKSCLHLSAENGYVRVLEVLKHAMMDGVYVDVEATDNSGMSVLQCASIALKATVCELESSKPPCYKRLHTLRQEQMKETLECVLQMGSYLHTMGSRSMQPRIG